MPKSRNGSRRTAATSPIPRRRPCDPRSDKASSEPTNYPRRRYLLHKSSNINSTSTSEVSMSRLNCFTTVTNLGSAIQMKSHRFSDQVLRTIARPLSDRPTQQQLASRSAQSQPSPRTEHHQPTQPSPACLATRKCAMHCRYHRFHNILRLHQPPRQQA